MKGLVADEIQQGQQEHHPIAEPLLHLVAEVFEHGAVQLNRSLKLLVELLVVQEYELQLTSARKQSQEIIAQAQAEAQKLASERVAAAQKEAIARKEAVAAEIAQQKEEAFRSLEGQVASLSRQILEKLLGPELVR